LHLVGILFRHIDVIELTNLSAWKMLKLRNCGWRKIALKWQATVIQPQNTKSFGLFCLASILWHI